MKIVNTGRWGISVMPRWFW